MANLYSIKEETLQNIANAVKENNSEKISITDIPEKIKQMKEQSAAKSTLNVNYEFKHETLTIMDIKENIIYENIHYGDILDLSKYIGEWIYITMPFGDQRSKIFDLEDREISVTFLDLTYNPRDVAPVILHWGMFIVPKYDIVLK